MAHPGHSLGEYVRDPGFQGTVISSAVGGAVGGLVGVALAPATFLGTVAAGAISGAASSAATQITQNVLTPCAEWHEDLLGATIAGGITAGLFYGVGHWVHGEAPLLTEQKHHVLSRPIMRELEKHATLSGEFTRDELTVQARGLADHLGYQHWHRAVDREVVEWLAANSEATVSEFAELLKRVYSRPEIAQKFPAAVDQIAKLFLGR